MVGWNRDGALCTETQTHCQGGHAMKFVHLPIAIRVFPALKRTTTKISKNKLWRQPRAMLVFDTETRTDETQRLTFGSYRFLVNDQLREEGLFYADDLPLKDRKVLEQ